MQESQSHRGYRSWKKHGLGIKSGFAPLFYAARVLTTRLGSLSTSNKMKKLIPLVFLAVLATSGFADEQMHTKKGAMSEKEKMAMASSAKVDSINTVCPIDGMKLGEMGKPVYVNYKGKKIGVCNADDAKMFKKNPAKYAALAEKNQSEKAMPMHGDMKKQ
jgi:YHS domain-containing protein